MVLGRCRQGVFECARQTWFYVDAGRAYLSVQQTWYYVDAGRAYLSVRDKHGIM